jgi:hypothetical protein
MAVKKSKNKISLVVLLIAREVQDVLGAQFATEMRLMTVIL